MTVTLRLSGDLAGLIIDSTLPVSFSIAKKDRECKITDSAVVRKPFKFKSFLADAGFIIGMFGDLWLAFVFPVQNPGTVSLQAGYYYGFIVFVTLYHSKVFQKRSSIENGWMENVHSPCSNLGDFYFYKSGRSSEYIECQKFKKSSLEDFYENLSQSAYGRMAVSAYEIGTVRKTVGEAVLLSESYDLISKICSTEYYIEFKGGQEALKKAVQKQQKTLR